MFGAGRLLSWFSHILQLIHRFSAEPAFTQLSKKAHALGESILNLLKPFTQYTLLISGDEYTTMFCVDPAVMELYLHLEDMKKFSEVKTCSIASPS